MDVVNTPVFRYFMTVYIYYALLETGCLCFSHGPQNT